MVLLTSRYPLEFYNNSCNDYLAIKTVSLDNKLFALFNSEQDPYYINVYCFAPDAKRWLKVDVENPELLVNDGKAGETDDLEDQSVRDTNFEVLATDTLEIRKILKNGVVRLYRFQFETRSWYIIEQFQGIIFPKRIIVQSNFFFVLFSNAFSALMLFDLNTDYRVFRRNLFEPFVEMNESNVIQFMRQPRQWADITEINGKVYLISIDFEREVREVKLIKHEDFVVVHEQRECDAWRYSDPFICTWNNQVYMLTRRDFREVSLEIFDIATLKWTSIEMEQGFDNHVYENPIIIDGLMYLPCWMESADGKEYSIQVIDLRPKLTTLCLSKIIHCILQNGNSNDDMKALEKRIPLRNELVDMSYWRMANRSMDF